MQHTSSKSPDNTQGASAADDYRIHTNTYDRTPLCVDLDGTLLTTDMLYESLLVLLRTKILSLFLLPFWLLKGKAHVKAQIARRVSIDVSLLPYNEKFLAYLREQHELGRPLVLATASDTIFAEQIAGHLGIIDKVIASDGKINMSAENKRDQLVALYGDRGFDYAANARPDIVVWKCAREVILVNPAAGIKKTVTRLFTVNKVFEKQKVTLKTYLKVIRVHQWAKNMLIFVPLFIAHRIGDPEAIAQSLVAFATFSLAASAMYLMNDLLDLPSDRAHMSKKNRGFASGAIPISQGIILTPIFLMLAFAGAFYFLSTAFILILGGYVAITCAYSLGLKRYLMLDVIILAGLFTIRILAGVFAIMVPLSHWLLVFSMFLFMSLALVKRYYELLMFKNSGKAADKNRAYRVVDLGALMSMGAASGYLAVMVFALYINSNAVTGQYSAPEALWLTCPLLLYWISRVWILTKRGSMHEDPVVFAMHDRASLLTLAMVGIIFMVASYV